METEFSNQMSNKGLPDFKIPQFANDDGILALWLRNMPGLFLMQLPILVPNSRQGWRKSNTRSMEVETETTKY